MVRSVHSRKITAIVGETEKVIDTGLVVVKDDNFRENIAEMSLAIAAGIHQQTETPDGREYVSTDFWAGGTNHWRIQYSNALAAYSN